jgi:hypothetical protein
LLIPTTKYGFAFCRKLGVAGAAVIAVGGVLTGVQPFTDPWAHVPGVPELRQYTVLSVLVVYTGLTLLLAAWWRIGALVRRPEGPTGRELTVTALWWAAPFALVTPVFSGDVYSYLAQGAMTAGGLDAYRVGPAALGGPLLANVPPIWQFTPAPYGPVFLDLAGAVNWVTGEHTWLGIVGMRMLAVVGVGLLAWSVPRLAGACGVAPNAAMWLAVLNPLVVLHLVADAHNDALMLGLMAAGLVFALQRHPVLGSGLIALAALTKAPAGLALAFIVPIWAGQLTGRLRVPRAAAGVAGAAGLTAVVTTTLAGTGFGWIRTLNTPTRARTWLSVTTDLGSLTGRVAEWLGVATTDEAMRVWWLTGLAAAVCVCVGLWRRSAEYGPVAALGLSLAARGRRLDADPPRGGRAVSHPRPVRAARRRSAGPAGAGRRGAGRRRCAGHVRHLHRARPPAAPGADRGRGVGRSAGRGEEGRRAARDRAAERRSLCAERLVPHLIGDRGSSPSAISTSRSASMAALAVDSGTERSSPAWAPLAARTAISATSIPLTVSRTQELRASRASACRSTRPISVRRRSRLLVPPEDSSSRLVRSVGRSW